MYVSHPGSCQRPYCGPAFLFSRERLERRDEGQTVDTLGGRMGNCCVVDALAVESGCNADVPRERLVRHGQARDYVNGT